MEYTSSHRGWVPATFLGPAEDGDETRCMVMIDGHRDIAKVTRWSLRLPGDEPAAP